MAGVAATCSRSHWQSTKTNKATTATCPCGHGGVTEEEEEEEEEGKKRRRRRRRRKKGHRVSPQNRH